MHSAVLAFDVIHENSSIGGDKQPFKCDPFRRDTMYGGVRKKTKWEKGRE